MPAFRDSTLSECGMRITWSASFRRSRGTPAPSLPTMIAKGPVRSASCSGMLLCEEVAGVPNPVLAHFANGFGPVGLRLWEAEQRACGGADCLRIVRIDGTIGCNETCGTEGFGGTNHRAEIAGIL